MKLWRATAGDAGGFGLDPEEAISACLANISHEEKQHAWTHEVMDSALAGMVQTMTVQEFLEWADSMDMVCTLESKELPDA